MACCTPNLLMYKYKPFFTENNIIKNEGDYLLCQIIKYNRPLIIDEEFRYIINFNFKDTIAAKNKRKLDLSIDTTIVKCYFGFFSVWIWEDIRKINSGKIEILKWDDNGIKIKEDIKVYDDIRKKRFMKFKGKRIFTKNKICC